MDFTLEEIRCILEEMGIKNVPENHLKHFAKGCYCEKENRMDLLAFYVYF